MSTPLHKFYLAGPMTGYPQFNFPAFLAAGKDLRERGYYVISPAEIDLEDVGASALSSPDGKLKEGGVTEDGYTWGDFLARDVKIVADKVEAVVCLPNWEDSKGARLEVYVALVCDKPVFWYNPQAEHGMTEYTFSYCADVCMARRSYNKDYQRIAFGGS